MQARGKTIHIHRYLHTHCFTYDHTERLTTIHTQLHSQQGSKYPYIQIRKGIPGKPLSPAVALSYTKEEALIITLSHRKHQMSILSPAEPLTYRHIHSPCHTLSFFSLLGDSPQPWSHEAARWGGGCWVCVLGMSY